MTRLLRPRLEARGGEVELAAVRASVRGGGLARLQAFRSAARLVIGACLVHLTRARIHDRAPVERALGEADLGVGAGVADDVEALRPSVEAGTIVAASPGRGRDEAEPEQHADGTERIARAAHGSLTSVGSTTEPLGSPAPSWPSALFPQQYTLPFVKIAHVE